MQNSHRHGRAQLAHILIHLRSVILSILIGHIGTIINGGTAILLTPIALKKAIQDSSKTSIDKEELLLVLLIPLNTLTHVANPRYGKHRIRIVKLYIKLSMGSVVACTTRHFRALSQFFLLVPIPFRAVAVTAAQATAGVTCRIHSKMRLTIEFPKLG